MTWHLNLGYTRMVNWWRIATSKVIFKQKQALDPIKVLACSKLNQPVPEFPRFACQLEVIKCLKLVVLRGAVIDVLTPFSEERMFKSPITTRDKPYHRPTPNSPLSHSPQVDTLFPSPPAFPFRKLKLLLIVLRQLPLHKVLGSQAVVPGVCSSTLYLNREGR